MDRFHAADINQLRVGDGAGCGEKQGIRACTTDHCVRQYLSTTCESETIAVVAAEEGSCARGISHKGVVARFAEKRVGSRASDEDVRIGTTEDAVIACFAKDGVVARIAEQRIVVLTAEDAVRSGTTEDAVSARIAEKGIIVSPAEDCVSPSAAGDAVVARIAHEAVRPVGTGDQIIAAKSRNCVFQRRSNERVIPCRANLRGQGIHDECSRTAVDRRVVRHIALDDHIVCSGTRQFAFDNPVPVLPDVVGVIALAADHSVGSSSAIEDIGPVIGAQRVIACPAEERVVSLATIDCDGRSENPGIYGIIASAANYCGDTCPLRIGPEGHSIIAIGCLEHLNHGNLGKVGVRKRSLIHRNG